MTSPWTLPTLAIAALIAAAPAAAQDPAPESAPEARPRVARPRADGDSPSVRAPRPASRADSGGQEAQPRVRRPAPEAVAAPEAAATPQAVAASAEQQGGVRRPRSGGGSSAGGSGRSGGGTSSGGTSSGGTVRARPGGVRNPAVDGGYDGQGVARAVPRGQVSRPPHHAYVAPYYGYGRRYYNPGGFGYYYYDPWSWYGYGYGWPGFAAYGAWGGYYGNVPYYYGGYGGYAAPFYGSGVYGAYAGPSGWSIGGVRMKVEPKDAEVYVDGYFAGIVDDFDGVWQQLRLDDGGHRIEVRKPGLETLTFEVMIQPGRTITYRGTLSAAP